MDMIFLIILVLFIILAFNVGPRKAMMISAFAGFMCLFIAFLFRYFYIPLLIAIIYFINKSRQPKRKGRTYYYWNSSTGQDFEDFFRNTGRTYGGYQGGYSGNYSGGQHNNPFTYTEDLTRYYSVLGVSKGASKDEIKKAYRNLVKQHHPDKFANNPSEKEYHENKLKEINEAYEKLIKD